MTHNSGKSNAVNRLAAKRLDVSPVVQTTRTPISAASSRTRGQLVFLDTPGLHKAEAPWDG